MSTRTNDSLKVLVTAVLAATVLPIPWAAATGNYLIITAQDYAGSAPLTQFAAAKAAMGYNVSTYVVPPGTSRESIKAYILSLWGTPDAPRYILLVGDTDGASATSNTIPHWVGGGSRHATTDLPYACMDPGDDWYPEIFIGRFSVRSVSMLQDVVNKTLTVESGIFPDPTYTTRAAFLATEDSTAQAEQNHDWVIANYLGPAEFQAIKIYARLGGNTQMITNAVNQGCLFVVYFGHSDSSGWWSPAFSQSNVNALSNTGLYGLVMGWSCNTAHIDYSECFGETWQRAPNKGAAAYLSASNYVWWGSVEAWESSRRMERYFFQSFFVDHIWIVSPAWYAALARIYNDPDYGPTHDHTRNIFEEFVLLGDPALHLPEPNGFTLAASPLTQDACTPPVTAVSYTVEVRRQGSFDQPVTLSASGLPPGTSVSFTPNSLVPPFTSEMTISGIGPAASGGYDIQITGTSASMQRGTAVRLNVSAALPQPVSLLSPPDGATDVRRRPTLTWQPLAEALEYDLEIATDPAFLQIVYTASSSTSQHEVTTNLAAATRHYWHVRGVNACGEGAFSQAFTFTTIEQSDYFTEQFTGSSDPFDLDYRCVRLYPDGSGDYYAICGYPISSLPTDPAGGTTLTLGDDNYVSVTPSAPVKLYGTSYTRFYVNSNGNLTFNSGDSTYTESLTAHFAQPRISALFDDLNPGAGGTVSWKQLPDRVAVTFQNVPEYGTSNQNTFQVEMLANEEIRISWLRIDALDGIAGISAGGGVPSDFLESNLSGAPYCPGDVNCDGAINAFDIDAFVLALTDPMSYHAQYPDCSLANADINGDGVVNAFDIDPFVGLLTGN
jgi:hypothetical protein